MTARRIIYLLAWIGCLVFFYAYQQWFAWFALIAVISLPIFSLLVSLPAMLTARLEVNVPEALAVGTPLDLELRCGSRMPTPLWTCRLQVYRPMTGESWKMKNGQALPTDHCGALICVVEKARICDYLGLVSLPLQHPQEIRLLVRPTPAAMQEVPELNRYISRAWRPKPGGGFSENHELRLYRPGDNIQQIHWKLSAKTGDLILREPMEPERGRVLLRLELRGTPEELDRKLGRLLTMGSHLLEQGIRFEIRCLTGTGLESWPVGSMEALQEAVDQILCRSCALSGSIRDRVEAASWQYDIGGGTDEA